jgi:hypothetical protein
MGGYGGTLICLTGGTTIVEKYATDTLSGWRIMYVARIASASSRRPIDRFMMCSLIHVAVFPIVLLGYRQPVIPNPQVRVPFDRVIESRLTNVRTAPS